MEVEAGHCHAGHDDSHDVLVCRGRRRLQAALDMEDGDARPPEPGVRSGSRLSESRQVVDDSVDVAPCRRGVHRVDAGVEVTEVQAAFGAVVAQESGRGLAVGVSHTYVGNGHRDAIISPSRRERRSPHRNVASDDKRRCAFAGGGWARPPMGAVRRRCASG
jgi:hypothetical protein